MNKYELIRLHEGERLMPYVDTVGKLSIGVGRNLADKGIRKDEMELMLANDLREAESELLRIFPWAAGLDPVRFYVLEDMVFNMGAPKVQGFVNTMRMVKDGEYEKASVAMLQSKWATQVGNRARRLSKMMRTGQWPKGPSDF
jgi:lysozyme